MVLPFLTKLFELGNFKTDILELYILKRLLIILFISLSFGVKQFWDQILFCGGYKIPGVKKCVGSTNVCV